MAEPIHEKIKRPLQAADGLYHRLVLLSGETDTGKTDHPENDSYDSVDALIIEKRGKD